MKKYSLLALLFALLTACQNSDQKNKPQAKTKISEVNCPPMVKFITAAEQTDSADFIQQIVQRKQRFIFSSGLPEDYQLEEWKKKNTLSNAISLYKSHREKNISHRYLPVFRQLGSFVILTRLDLIGSGDADDVFYFTNELIETQYEGYCLLYQCLAYLKDQKYDAEKVRKCKDRVLEYVVNNPQPQQTAKRSGSDNIPENVKERLLQMEKERNLETQKYIELIRTSI